MRDLRDPQLLGSYLLELRQRHPSLSLSQMYDLRAAAFAATPAHNSNPSCIDKYGRADEVEPVFMEVRVK